MAIRPARLPLLPTKVLLRLARVDRANISPNKTSGGTTPAVSYACRVLAALRVHPWQRCTVHSAKHRRSAGLKENKQIDQANTEKKKNRSISLSLTRRREKDRRESVPRLDYLYPPSSLHATTFQHHQQLCVFHSPKSRRSNKIPRRGRRGLGLCPRRRT